MMKLPVSIGPPLQHSPHWATRASLLWRDRKLLLRVALISFVLSLTIACIIPKRYKSTASIMPPDQQGSSAMMLAALAGRTAGAGALGSLASGLLGTHTTTALFIDLLRSSTVSGHLIHRFDLQRVYRTRYAVDTAKHLARNTTVADDKKSGVITIEVEDVDPTRARDLVQGYLDELNRLVVSTNTSAAHRERVFIEGRLNQVQRDLEQAQVALSDFSSKNNTIDIKEQSRAMVDAGAKVQGELLIEQSGLESLRQIYGNDNIRIHETQARIATLQRELTKLAGSSHQLTPPSDTQNGSPAEDSADLYPSLRQLPRLAVPYADLYRKVRIDETGFELLTQQYEIARLEEAKDIPAVSVIDAPGIAEKKSFPPRAIITLLLTLLSVGSAAIFILMRDHYTQVASDDPSKQLALEILSTLRTRSIDAPSPSREVA